MKQNYYFKSCGIGNIHVTEWTPDTQVKAVVQIVHGIAEHMDRYDHFARYLNDHGIAVVGEDHMGHGGSIGKRGIRGYFHGGWFAAVDDTYQLMKQTMDHYPNVPYILLGHSMGSFMARTILARYPDSGIVGCILSGTAWQPDGLLVAGLPASKLICKFVGEKNCSQKLYDMIFGAYNQKVEHARTASDWLSRDSKIVDAYVADPLCGFIPTAGLLRDMMEGMAYIQKTENLAKMNTALPVYFVAGGEDPVGAYGAGVREAAERFRKTGMEHVSVRIYPLCRHEILNEINRDEVYEDTLQWIENLLQSGVNV